MSLITLEFNHANTIEASAIDALADEGLALIDDLENEIEELEEEKETLEEGEEDNEEDNSERLKEIDQEIEEKKCKLTATRRQFLSMYKLDFIQQLFDDIAEKRNATSTT